MYFGAVLPNGRVSKAPQPVTPSRSGSPSLIQVHGTLHLTWLEGFGKKGVRLGYRRSSDRGEKWSDAVYLESPVSSSHKPMLFEGPGGVLMVFASSASGANQPERVWCQRSGDQGVTWEKSSPQPPGWGPPSDVFARIDGDGVDLTWIERRTEGVSIMFSRSTDAGKAWMPAPVAVVRASRLALTAPQLVRSKDRVVVFWRQPTDKGNRVFLSWSGDGGKSWTMPSEIDGQSVRQVTYHVLGDAHNAHVVSVEQLNVGRNRTYNLRVKRLDLSDLSSRDGGVVSAKSVWSDSYSFKPEFQVLAKGQMLLTAAAVRPSIDSTSLILLSSDRFSDRTDISQVAPDERRRSRSLVALAGLPDAVGVVYREQQARRLPMEVRPGDLLFKRVPLTNETE